MSYYCSICMEDNFCLNCVKKYIQIIRMESWSIELYLPLHGYSFEKKQIWLAEINEFCWFVLMIISIPLWFWIIFSFHFLNNWTISTTSNRRHLISFLIKTKIDRKCRWSSDYYEWSFSFCSFDTISNLSIRLSQSVTKKDVESRRKQSITRW